MIRRSISVGAVMALAFSVSWLLCGLPRAGAGEPDVSKAITWLPIGDCEDTWFSLGNTTKIRFSPDDQRIFLGTDGSTGLLWLVDEQKYIEYGQEPAAGANRAESKSKNFGKTPEIDKHRKQYVSRRLNAFQFLALLDDRSVAYVNESRLGGSQIVSLAHDSDGRGQGRGRDMQHRKLKEMIAYTPIWRNSKFCILYSRRSPFATVDIDSLKVRSVFDPQGLQPTATAVGLERAVTAFVIGNRNGCVFVIANDKSPENPQRVEFTAPEGMRLDGGIAPFFVNHDRWLVLHATSAEFAGLIFVDASTGRLVSRFGCTKSIVKASANRAGTVLALTTDYPETLIVAALRDNAYTPVLEESAETIGLVRDRKYQPWELSSAGDQIAFVDTGSERAGLLNLKSFFERSPSGSKAAESASKAHTLDDYRAEEIPFGLRRAYHPQELVHRFESMDSCDRFAVDPSGRWIAFSLEGDLHLIDTSQPQEYSLDHLLERAGVPKWLRPVGQRYAFAANGRLLLTTSYNGSVGVWNLTGKQPQLVTHEQVKTESHVDAVLVLPKGSDAAEGERFAVGRNGGFRLWEYKAGTLRHMGSIDDSGTLVATSAGGDAVFTIGQDKALREYGSKAGQAPVGRRLLPLPAANENYYPKVYSSPLRGMWGWDDDELFVWNFNGQELSPPKVRKMTGDVSQMWPSPASRQSLVSVEETRGLDQLQIFDAGFRQTAGLAIPGKVEWAAAFPDRRYLLVKVRPQDSLYNEVWLLRLKVRDANAK